MAAGLARRLPWLARGHIGTLCDALASLGLDSNGWTAHDVIEHLDAANAADGRYQPAPGTQRNPVGLFVVQAQRALAEAEPPVMRRQHEAQERAAQRARDAASRAVERERLAAQALDPETQARIALAKASIRVTLAAQRPRHVRSHER